MLLWQIQATSVIVQKDTAEISAVQIFKILDQIE